MLYMYQWWTFVLLLICCYYKKYCNKYPYMHVSRYIFIATIVIVYKYVLICKINYFKMELWGQRLCEFKILINIKLPSLYVRPIFRFTNNSAGTYFSNSDYSQTIWYLWIWWVEKHLIIDQIYNSLTVSRGTSIHVFWVKFFFFFAAPSGIWDLSSLIRDQTLTPCSGNSLNHWPPAKALFINFKVTSTFKMQACLALDSQLFREKVLSFSLTEKKGWPKTPKS